MMIAVSAPFIYHFATIDAELWNDDLRIQSEKRLKKEMKEIKLPPKRAVNKFQKGSKTFSIFIETRYRTEISQEEFVRHFKDELEKVGWIYYRKSDFYHYLFCRGKRGCRIVL
jgi:hypothetical protein